MTSVTVVKSNLENHPKCIHGPTLLFSRLNENKQFFACAACRDRKDCSFFLWKDDLKNFSNSKKNFWDNLCLEFLNKQPEHIKLFQTLNKMKAVHFSMRCFCHDCQTLFWKKEELKHISHNIVTNIKDELLNNPSKLLLPKDNPKKEAQYLFSAKSVKTIINILKKLNLRNAICIGAPRIYEYIQNSLLDLHFNSILLDIDERYRHFIGPLQFCWYNSFNNYFFEGKKSENVFKDFLKIEKGANMCIIMDPPFGGRVEPLTDVLEAINVLYQKLNKIKTKMPIFLMFPYFMEPQILNSLPNFTMLDYKVDYENHCLFTDKPKGRKYGSPVRIFTNILPSEIILPEEEGYKYCNLCNKWVSNENLHCNKCNDCTSKNGSTYSHCDICERCVKPSWRHCFNCNRCVVQDHHCAEIEFLQNCFHCKEPGHKKRECPNLDKEYSKRKRCKSKFVQNKKKRLNKCT